jgi:xylulokinase
MTILLGIDAGTTALKCAAFDSSGKPLAVSTQEYPLLTPRVNFVEVPVETYWAALKKGLAELRGQYDFSGSEVALSFSAQGETLICLDKEGCVLRNAIVWLDNRAVDEAAVLKAQFGHKTCYEVTGQVSFEPCWPASKVLWLRNWEPEVFARTAKFLLVEDYLIYRMTGKFVTEGSLLCSSTYWNIVTRKYWPEMLKFLGIREEQLPEVLESGVLVGDMLDEVREELGFSAKVSVSTGALDQAAGALGVGNVRQGMFSEAVGAAVAFCVPVNQPTFDPNRKMPLHYFAIPDMYMIHTFTNGGMTLRWFRDKFCDLEMGVEKAGAGDSYYLIDREAETVPPGSDGLVMLPHLSGSLAPDVNAKAKGVWFGFTLAHTRAHFARAIMESLGYIMHRNIDALSQMGIRVSEVRALGGGSRSGVWNQIQADINQIRVVTMVSREAPCLGAAILAGRGAGIFNNVADAVTGMATVKNAFDPNPDNKGVYEEGYVMYKKLFKDLSECFDKTI